MTLSAAYAATCDRCGADLGNGSLTECVAIMMQVLIGADYDSRVLHLGLDHRCGCASQVLTKSALAFYTAKVDAPGAPPVLYASAGP